MIDDGLPRESAGGPALPVLVDCVRGDIARQPEFDAVVCAANPQLSTGSGVAGALHRGAGPGLEREAGRFAPLATGEAVVTGGHGLPNRWVIHTVGPIHGHDEPAPALLAACYRNALARAEEHGMRSVAFPALSTGVYGYPLREAAEVALGTVLASAPGLRSVRHVRFVLFGEEDLRVHQEVLEGLRPG